MGSNGMGAPAAGGSSQMMGAPPNPQSTSPFMGQGSGAPAAFPLSSMASAGGNSQQGNQRRSLLSAYPLHGAVSLSNVPGPPSAASTGTASKTASNSLVPD